MFDFEQSIKHKKKQHPRKKNVVDNLLKKMPSSLPTIYIIYVVQIKRDLLRLSAVTSLI